MCKVTVITMSKDYGHFIRECLESVAAQTYRDFEHIVVDAASADNTFAIAKEYTPHVIRLQEDWGLSTSRNAGLMLARGEFIVSIDADDKIHPQFLEKLVPHAGYKKIVCPGLQEFGTGTGAGWPCWGFTQRDFLANNRVFCCSMYSRAMWAEVGGYDRHLDFMGCEDWELWTNMIAHGCTVTIVPEILFYYRVHPASSTARCQQYNAQRIDYIREKHKI
jgi:glycosyltransferase involved in cell wall biosynthesis